MPSMPAAKKGQATKTFFVAKGVRMGDPQGSGKILEAGDPVKLTKDQAQFLLDQPTRIINVELPDFDEPDAEPADSDTPESGSGDKAEGSGDAAAGGVPAEKNAQAEGADTPRRKKASL